MASLQIKHCTPNQASIDNLHALACGTLQALVIDHYLTSGASASAALAFDRSLFGDYESSRYVLPAQRFGSTLNEHRVNRKISDQYWEYADRATRVWQQTRELRDLRHVCLERLSSVFRAEVGPATVEGRALYWGILREIKDGTLIHWDDISLEYPAGTLAAAKESNRRTYPTFAR